MLLRSPRPVQNALRVFDDVYASSDRVLIEKTAESGAAADQFRTYAGYAGWAPGQLRSELKAGGWQVRPGDAALVFHSHPETLWPKLSGQLQVARIGVSP